MRIALVTPNLMRSGGVGKIVAEYARYLTNSFGHDVTVFAHNEPDMTRDRDAEYEIRRFSAVNIKQPYTISFGMLRSLLGDKFDIIHSHHYGYAPATVGFAAAKLKRTKHVISTYYHPPFYGTSQRLAFSLYHMTQGFQILKFSDSVISMTNHEKRMLLRLGANDVDVLPGFVDTSVFRPKNIGREKLVLFVSRLSTHKGAATAFRIADEMTQARSDVKFVFIGSPPHESGLAAYYDSLKKRRNIRFLSNLAEEELVTWLNRASVFMLPSKYEAFGLVMAEAQACGTPVVASNVGGIPDVVKNGETGFLTECDDVKEMKKHIETLVDDSTLNRKMGRAARKHTINNFDTKNVIKKLNSIYGAIA
jgi:glycosyltransferase involved in cell wall biosynthesis